MKTFRSFSIEPKTASEITEAATPNGMRKRIRHYSYENPLVRSVIDSAAAQGFSGEDTMTWLAFEALRRVEKLEDLILDESLTKPAASMIYKP